MTRYRVIMLREGVFQGVSPPKPIRFSRRAIASAASTMEGKPFKLNHNGADAKVAGAHVGVVRNVRFAQDALQGDIVLDPKAEHFGLAKMFLDATLALGGWPNVSIEGSFVGVDKGSELEVESIQFSALSGVHRGACSDLAGCGVVAALSQGVSTMDTTNTTNAEAVSTVTATDGTVAAPVAGTVTFTVVPEAEKSPCGCKDAEAKLAALPTLEAELAEAKKANATLNAELAAAKLAIERAPLVAELGAVLPDLKTDGMGVSELKAALAASKLAPKSSGEPARKTLLAEPVPKLTPREALAALVAKEMRR